MLAWDVEEDTEVGCFIYGGTYAEYFLGVWYTSNGGAIIQVIGAHFIINIWRLATGGEESAICAVKLGADGKYPGERRGRWEDYGKTLCGGGSIGDIVWVGDVSDDPLDVEGPRGIPPPGVPADGGHGIQMQIERYMGISTHLGGTGNGRTRRDWDV